MRSSSRRGLARRLTLLITVGAMALTAACSSAGSADPEPPATSEEAADPPAADDVVNDETDDAPVDDAAVEPADSADAPTEPAAFPVIISAANGDITIDAQPQAIVSLSATGTEMLYAIGAGDQVIAVDKYSDYPAGVPTTDLSGFSLNVEALVGYQPDLVITGKITPEQQEQFDELTFPVISLPSATGLADTYAQIEQLGAATGHVDEAAAVNDSIATEIAEIVASMPVDQPEHTYYYELSLKLSSVTSGTFMGEVLGLLNLTSIADPVADTATTPGYPQLSAEYILGAQPDYIFLAEVGSYPEAADLDARPGWSDLTAVADGRVVILDDDISMRWGPRIVTLVREVADALVTHPVS